MANKPNKSTNKTEPQGSKKSAKDKGKDSGKVSFSTRVKNFFRGLKNELKLVVWPDKKNVKQTTAVVLVIVALAAVLIFVVDSIMTGVLGLAGFNVAPPTPTTTPAVTTPAVTTGASETTVDQTGITSIPTTEPATTSTGN